MAFQSHSWTPLKTGRTRPAPMERKKCRRKERIYRFNPSCLETLQGLEVPQAHSCPVPPPPPGSGTVLPQPRCPLLGCLAGSRVLLLLLLGSRGAGARPWEGLCQLPKWAP